MSKRQKTARDAGEPPGVNRLQAFAADELQRDERAKVSQHLSACSECQSFLGLITPEEGPPTPVALSGRTRQRR